MVSLRVLALLLLLTGCPPNPANYRTGQTSQLIADLKQMPAARVILSVELEYRIRNVAIPTSITIERTVEGIVLSGPGPELATLYERISPLPPAEAQ